MKAFIHSTAEVNERVQAVLAKAKAVSGVSEGFEFRPLPDTHTPPMDYPVLSLGAYQRRGLERAVVTYSPAQIVSKADALTHLAHAFRVLAGQHDLPEFEYRVFEDSLEATCVLGDMVGTTIAVDIETKGDADSQVPAWEEIISIGFYDGTEAYVVSEDLLFSTAVQGMIQQVMSKSTCILAAGKFDLKYLGVKPKVFEDTMLMHYSLYPAAPKHGLKDTADELFGADDWDKAMKKQFLKKETVKAYEDRGDGAYAQAMSYTANNGYERIPRDVLYKYNGLDVYWTYHVYMLLKEYMDNDPEAQRLYREHLMPLSDMYQDVEAHGIRFDINYMIDLADTLTKEGEQLQLDLNEIAGRPVNPRSPKQVKEWFAEQGVSTTTTAEEFLVEHIENAVSGITVDFARKLLELRKNAKMNGTYITGYLKQLIGDRGYPGYKLHASITGRLGGAGPSMLTIPRDKRIKKMVLPDDGHVVVSSDLSQAELRVMAAESNDPWMLGAFQPDAGDFFDNLIMNTYPDLDLEKFKVEKPGEAKDMRARFKGVVYGCVPMDTEILTRRGWLTVDEVREGDYTPGIDPETGKGSWTRINLIHRYEPQQLYRYGHSRWSMEVTAGHKWVVNRRVRKSYPEAGFSYVETGQIVKDDRLIVSRKIEGDTEEYLTDTEVRVLAWLLSDGHMKQSSIGGTSQGADLSRRGMKASIMQAKPKYIKVIDDLMVDVPHSRYVKPGVNYDEAVTWKLSQPYARELIGKTCLVVDEKSQVYKVEDFVLSLSTRQREMFVEVFCQAEGHWNGKTWKVVQKDGSKLNAFILAAQLCGYRPAVTLHENGTDAYNVNLCGKTDVGTNTADMVPTKVAPVWCVTTDLGSWTMRQGRRVAVTGNTSFGRGAKAIAAAIEVSQEEGQELIDAYVRPGSEFAQWRKDIARLATGAGVLSNPLGRKYQAEVVTYKNKANIERSGLSFPSQSTANDICLTAALSIHKRLAEEFPEARMIGTIHDAIYVSAPEHLAREIGYMLRDEMQGAGRKFYGDKVAFESVPEMGYNLGETKEFPEIGW